MRALWGNIILALMGEAKTSSQIAYCIEKDISEIRRELILMNHYGLIEPIGVRSEDDLITAGSYYADILWSLTEHSIMHHDINEDCHACELRRRLLRSRR